MAKDEAKEPKQPAQAEPLDEQELEQVNGGYIGQILVKYDAFKEPGKKKIQMI